VVEHTQSYQDTVGHVDRGVGEHTVAVGVVIDSGDAAVFLRGYE
jgi:hypothetical protein